MTDRKVGQIREHQKWHNQAGPHSQTDQLYGCHSLMLGRGGGFRRTVTKNYFLGTSRGRIFFQGRPTPPPGYAPEAKCGVFLKANATPLFISLKLSTLKVTMNTSFYLT